MKTFFDSNTYVPLYDVDLFGLSSPAGSHDVDAMPIATFHYDGRELKLLTDLQETEERLQEQLRGYGIYDAFGLVEAIDQQTLTPKLALADDPMFNLNATVFLARSLCSLVNRNEELFENNAIQEIIEQKQSTNPLLDGRDTVEILRLIKLGYQNAGPHQAEFYVPVFTAFPIYDLDLEVALNVTGESSQETEFGITLPGLSGGFSSTTSTSFAITHPESSVAVQYQQMMRAEITTWRNDETEHEIQSFSFHKAQGKQIAYENEEGDWFLPCHVEKDAFVDLEPLNIRPGPGKKPVQYQYKIAQSASASVQFKASPLGADFELGVTTVSKGQFEVSYMLLRGYRYLFRVAGQDSHYFQALASRL